jgi:hypothetical protein
MNITRQVISVLDADVKCGVQVMDTGSPHNFINKVLIVSRLLQYPPILVQ